MDEHVTKKSEAWRAARLARKPYFEFENSYYDCNTEKRVNTRKALYEMGVAQFTDPLGIIRSTVTGLPIRPKTERQLAKARGDRTYTESDGTTRYVSSGLPVRPKTERQLAKARGDRTYTESDGTTRYVSSGLPVASAASLSPRALARRAGDRTYTESDGTVRYVSSGLLVASRNEARIAARAAGHRTYVHADGTTRDTHTNLIRDTKTARSPKDKPAKAPNPRAEARRAGGKVYLATCPVHGEHGHSVAHGVCLGCYNTVGVVRPKRTNPIGYYVDENGHIFESPT